VVDPRHGALRSSVGTEDGEYEEAEENQVALHCDSNNVARESVASQPQRSEG